MAYHIFTSDGISHDELFLDLYLGSAITIDFYWESVGKKIGLPIIASLTELADSEEGFMLVDATLVEFKNELEIFEEFWNGEGKSAELPERLLENIACIKEGVNFAIAHKLKLFVCQQRFIEEQLQCVKRTSAGCALPEMKQPSPLSNRNA